LGARAFGRRWSIRSPFHQHHHSDKEWLFTSVGGAGQVAAQFAKDTKLATIVGKQTGTNVLRSTMFNVGNG
jgi:hypothetical protein